MQITTKQLKKLIRETVEETLEEQNQLGNEFSASMQQFARTRQQSPVGASAPQASQQQKTNILNLIQSAVRSGVITAQELMQLARSMFHI